MNDISIIFTRSRHWWKMSSRIICWWIKRPYSHVAIIFKSPWLGIDMVIQASHGMVHILPLESMSRDNMIVRSYTIPMQQEEIARGVRWAFKMCGRGYSEIGAISATVGILRAMKLGRNGDQEFICSEFGARFIEESRGISLDHLRAVDYVDPAMLEDLIIYLSKASS